MKVTVIQLYQDKYTQEIHKPGEIIEEKSAKRVSELLEAGVIEKVVIPDPPAEEAMVEAVDPEPVAEEKPVKKATPKKTTKKSTAKK